MAEALLVSTEKKSTASGALASGQIIQLTSGLAAVVMGLTAIASGDEYTVMDRGVFDITSASGTTFSDGEDVYWDASANLAVPVGSIGTGDWYLGRAHKAKVSGETVVRVDLNAPTRQAFVADASVAHALNGTFDDAEVEAALDALGAKVNSILATLKQSGLMLPIAAS